MCKSGPEISKRQKQLLEELGICDDEMSGQELHRRLHEKELSMGLTTIYRNLQALVKRGLVRSRHLPTGEVLYAPVDRDVHHLTCVDCGQTTRLKGCPVKDIELPKNKGQKFEVLFHTLELFGLCELCFQRQKKKV
ncbi:transcriptional repressor [Prochlorococcus sp. MIT 1307]|uniref:Fur family transcriptional regulator n=1 Tax=Prochlorococcus sp. MIT 1307 TaxID=3096219 RepID=UPI002A766C15|nr:transcriptional repressor [Prochlorococcus sp. MIT 1307]